MNTYKAVFFSQFMLTDGAVTLTQEEMRSNRLLNLLSFLIVNRGRNLSLSEISTAVCGEEAEQNGPGVVKNLVWRMRKLLKTKWPEESFILTFRGGYKLNPELSVATDYEDMEALIRQADQTDAPEAQAALLNRAFEQYTGPFMAGDENGRWAANLAIYLQNDYMATAKRLAALYESFGQYADVERVVRRAVVEEPLDETLWSILIRSYGEDGKMQMAEETFQQVSESLYKTLGIGPSEELTDAYKSTLEQVGSEAAGVEAVMHVLQEADQPEGAYYCEIGVFKKIYELTARRLSRLGFPVHIALINLELRDGKAKGDANAALERGMAQMKACIVSTLRTGDVAARYSRTQFVVLLPACQYETGEMVMHRIFNKFDRQKGSDRYRRCFTLREVLGNSNEIVLPAFNRNSASALRVCIDDQLANGEFGGHITGVAVRTPVHFEGALTFVRAVNQILDEVGRPKTNAISRKFGGGPCEGTAMDWQYVPVRYHTPEAVAQDTGALKTFDIQFSGRNQNTWQGTLSDESGREAAFVSELDLVRQVKKMYG